MNETSSNQSIPPLVLIDWFEDEGRDLPWRHLRDPYSTWVAEVMLQQTQVTVVIPYYQRWLTRFPSIHALAIADEEEILKYWEGLGYYSRARHLHLGAKYVLRVYDGELPNDPSKLKRIPGIGPYTLGAIMSFAFQKKMGALDANVIRVLTRYFLIQEDVSKNKNITKLRMLLETLLPENTPWKYNEALIELGAIVCRKKPLCEKCPIKNGCRSYQTKWADLLPLKAPANRPTTLQRTVLIILYKGRVLVKKEERETLMRGLYQFPFVESDNDTDFNWIDLIHSKFQISTDYLFTLPTVTHSFTKYKAILTPKVFETTEDITESKMTWLPLEELLNRPFCSGHRQVLAHLTTYLQNQRSSGRGKRATQIFSVKSKLPIGNDKML